MVSRNAAETSPLIPSVVVVDPCFEAYRHLVAAARAGQIGLHLRSSGREALKLASRLDVDAWFVAADLEDMAGADFLKLLDTLPGTCAARKAAVAEAPGAEPDEADLVLSHPITLADLDAMVRLPAAERAARLPAPPARGRAVVSLPVGIGAAMITLALLMMG